MQNFDSHSAFELPKPGVLWLTVFSLMHRAQDDASDISDSATDLLGGPEQGSASGQNGNDINNPCKTFTDLPVKRTLTLAICFQCKLGYVI